MTANPRTERRSRSPLLEEKIENKNSSCNMQVVFVDIVRYSKRTSHNQLEVIKAFMKSIERALDEIALHYQDYIRKNNINVRRDVVALPSGDGALIAFPFEGVHDMHLFFAATLLRILDTRNKTLQCKAFLGEGWCDCHDAFLLRCGIAEGKLILYRDLNGNYNIAGHTVNMAARVMDIGDAGQVFTTEEAFREITQMVPNTMQQFRRYPSAQVKHTTINVYQYIDGSCEGLNTSPNTKLELTRSVEAHQSRTQNPEVQRTSLVDEVNKQLRTIPTGEFVMGNKGSRKVLIQVTRSFLICKHPVTQALYSEVTAQNPSRFHGEQRPVENVSWMDAINFCNLLSQLSGLNPVYDVKGNDFSLDLGKNGYRLPTEAEWEYACLAGNSEDRYGPIEDIAWYSSNSGRQTHPVGKKAENEFGLYDMLGNVWEWCHDWHQLSPPQDRLKDYAGPISGLEKVVRGGSWSDLPESVTSRTRNRKSHLMREDTLGFRIVRTGK